MCKYAKCLIAWMDGELGESESAEVEQHVQACAACRECVASYEAASREFASYYEATTKACPVLRSRKISRWVPVAAAVAAVAAMLAIAFVVRASKEVPTVHHVAAVQAPVATSPVIETTAQASQPAARDHYPPYLQKQAIGVGHPRRAAKPKGTKTEWAMAEPAIQIAIPADAMFPPGAVPEGVTYIANVSLGGDGRVQGVQLATSN